MIPSYVRLKALGRLLKKPQAALARQLPEYRKHYKKITCLLDGRPHLFRSLTDVVVPFGDAAQLAERAGFRAVHLDREPDQHAVGAACGARTPVVVLLGHYDHGKTTLLDALLDDEVDATVASTEHDGITQEIRARRVDLAPGGDAPHAVTILDTPGQDIFYRLRNIGALGADLALLVVDAAEGIGDQTEESIGCAEELGVPVVVALNKVDLVDDERLDALAAELRGYVALERAPVLAVSALHRRGLDALREQCVAELHGRCVTEPISAGTDAGDAPVPGGRGLVLDYRTGRTHGRCFHVLLRHGAVREGDYFVCGLTHGRVRVLRNDQGGRGDGIAPGDAVHVACVFKGALSESPVGEPFLLLTAEEAEGLVEERAAAIDLERARIVSQCVGDESEDNGEEPEGGRCRCVIKTDSANALATVLDALADDYPHVEVVMARIGDVNKTDLEYAAGNGASVYCFETKDGSAVRELARHMGVRIHRYSTLQGLIDSLAGAAAGSKNSRVQ